MDIDYTKRSEFEAKTRELFDTYLRKDENFTTRRAAISLVFFAKWSCSLNLAQITEIANALTSTKSEAVEYRTAIAALIHAKVLRKRKQGGETLYEVNY